jgi:YVTN family beta-propeller protein
VVVHPNSVAVVDPKARRLVADIPVGARPVAIAVGEGAVWVANADDATVSKIDPKTRKVVANVGIGADLSDIAVGYGSVWVADGNDGTVTKIDPKLNAIADTLRVGKGNALAPEPVFWIAVGNGAVWVTRGNAVLRIDPVTDEVSDQIPVPPATGLAVGAGAVWVVTQDERLLRISLDSKRMSGSLDLQQGGFAPVVAGGSVWLIDFVGTGSIWRVDPASVTQDATLGAGSFPVDFAVAGKLVWAVDDTGSILRVDSEANRITARVPTGIGGVAMKVAYGDGAVWVAVSQPTS